MYRRRGRIIGSLIVGGLLLFALIYAFLGPRPTPPTPFVKAEVGRADRTLRGPRYSLLMGRTWAQ